MLKLLRILSRQMDEQFRKIFLPASAQMIGEEIQKHLYRYLPARAAVLVSIKMCFIDLSFFLLFFSLIVPAKMGPASHLGSTHTSERIPVAQAASPSNERAPCSEESNLLVDSDAISVSTSMYQRAAELLKLGNLAAAESCYRAVLEVRLKLVPGTVQVAQTLNGLGDVAVKRGQLVAAESLYWRAFHIAARLKSASSDLANSIHGIGNVAFYRGEFAKAEKYFTQALVIRKTCCPNSLEMAKSFVDLAVVARYKGDLYRAQKLNNRAFAIQQKLAPGSLEIADTLTSFGTLAFLHGEYYQAERYYLQALAIQERISPDGLNVAHTLSRLGAVAYDRGNRTASEAYYKRALKITSRLAPESLRLAAVLTGLHFVAFDRGDLDKAEDHLRQALAIQEKLAPNSHDVAISLSHLAEVFALQGFLAKSEEYERRAYAIRQQENPGSPEVAGSLTALGDIAQKRDDLTSASRFYTSALAIQQKMSPSGMRASVTLVQLGNIKREHGNLVEAANFYHRAAAIQRKLIPESLEFTETLNALGEVSRMQGDLTKAEDYEHQAFAIQQRLSPGSIFVARTLTYLGNVARDRHDTAKAEAYYRESIAITEKSAPATTENAQTIALLALMLRKKQPGEAEKLYRKFVTSIEAQMSYLGGSEEVRYGFRAKYEGHYKNYLELLIALNKPVVAFEISERIRARSLLENLASAGVDIRKGADTGLLEQERSLRASVRAKYERRMQVLNGRNVNEQLLALNNEIDDLLKQKEEITRQIRDASPAYIALTQPQPLSAGEIQQLLDADTVLLEYSLGAQHSYVFVVDRDSVHVYELPEKAEIEAAARAVYEIVTARTSVQKGETEMQRMVRVMHAETQYPEAARQLSRMILGPIARHLSGRRLLIVADGILQYLPFSALPDPENRLEFAPLIAEHEIVNLPSATVLQTLKQESARRAPPPREVAILADPVFDATDPRVRSLKKRSAVPVRSLRARGEAPSSFSRASLMRSATEMGMRSAGKSFPRLVFTLDEAKSILQQSSPDKTKLAVDFQASRSTALSPELADYRILHFATHGFLNSQHPELSALVMSLVDQGGRPQDGFLTLDDIYNLSLRSDLVVLSACETGLGKEINGEGMVGITRGFMYAGASRIVTSLWKVDDRATAELMSKFYYGMLKQGLQPAAALRQAQIEMWRQKRWSSPFYWAGFVMQGQW
jgi:CHAT domain-containing protein/Tfp pilus assembly protein PilF